MRSAFRKGQKVHWIGSATSKAYYHDFPPQIARVISTDGRRGMTLISCLMHFKDGKTKPRHRDRWVMDDELTKACEL